MKDKIPLKGGKFTTDRRLDRVVQFDPRSRQFPIRALIAKTAKPRSFTWSCTIQLNQGNEGACCGFGVSHEAAARPVCVPGITNESAHVLYKRAQDLDEWPGSDYDGTSVIAAVKAAQEKGYYPEYRWSFGLDDQILAVGLHGPGVLGVEWRDGMYDTDSDGFIHYTGDVVGGHCILCRGVNVKKKYFLLRNSWGSSWGVNGDCKISFDDMDKLIHAQGECCIPTKRALGPVATPVTQRQPYQRGA